jgi:carboxypeptidase Taq
VFAVNNVEATFIRVTADEVTYNLHILIRFELELALIAGDLAPAELPGAWNSAYRHYLGISPANDAEGCLQDGHWASGLFGYFPTYTLGNVYAAQLYAQIVSDLGDPGPAFARGEFHDILGWLRKNIYHQGGRHLPGDLIERVTGSPPSHQPLLQLLHQKYGELYRV